MQTTMTQKFPVIPLAEVQPGQVIQSFWGTMYFVARRVADTVYLRPYHDTDIRWSDIEIGVWATKDKCYTLWNDQNLVVELWGPLPDVEVTR